MVGSMHPKPKGGAYVGTEVYNNYYSMNADFAAGVGWTSYRNEDKLDNTERNGTRGRGNLPPPRVRTRQTN